MLKFLLIIARKNKKSTRKNAPRTDSERAFLRFPNEFLTALGTFDADLAPAAGDADGLLAVGAAVIAVLPVQEPGLPGQKTPVFQDPLFEVPGEEAEQIPDQQPVGNHVHQHAEDGADGAVSRSADPREEQGNEVEDHCRDK